MKRQCDWTLKRPTWCREKRLNTSRQTWRSVQQNKRINFMKNVQKRCKLWVAFCLKVHKNRPKKPIKAAPLPFLSNRDNGSLFIPKVHILPSHEQECKCGFPSCWALPCFVENTHICVLKVDAGRTVYAECDSVCELHWSARPTKSLNSFLSFLAGASELHSRDVWIKEVTLSWMATVKVALKF